MKLFLIFIFLVTSVRAEKKFHLAIIDSQIGEPYSTIRENLYKYLRLYGLDRNKNLVIQEFSIGNKPGTVKNIWKHYVKGKSDLVYVSGTMATIGSYKYLKGLDIPVIFAAPTDPVGIGVIDNFKSSPKLNFTGICYPVKVEQRLRFIKKLFPKAKTIGHIHSLMPQSLSYKKWLDAALEKDEFKDLTILHHSVDFIASERGQERMASISKEIVKKIDSQVDLYISPNDQMGTQSPFAQMINAESTKPLIGIGKKDVTQNWGAHASIAPSLEDIAKNAAFMISEVAKGKSINSLLPKWPKYNIYIHKKKMKALGHKIPKEYKRFLVDPKI